MEIKNHVRKLTFRAISILLLVIATASLPNSKGGITRNQAVNQYQWNDPNTPISATLRIDHLPTLGEPAKVDCIVSSKLDAPGTQVQIELPSDAKLLKGNLGWEGDILTGDSITVTATIAFSSIGNKGIFCRALRSRCLNPGFSSVAACLARDSTIPTPCRCATGPSPPAGGTRPPDSGAG